MFTLVRKMAIIVLIQILKDNLENQAFFCKIFDSHDQGHIILNFNYELL